MYYAKLAADVAAKQGEMEATLGLIQELNAKTDVEEPTKVTKLAALDANFKALEVDMEALTVQMQRAEMSQAAKALAKKALEASVIVPPVLVPASPGKAPARAKTFGEEEALHRNAFQKWLGLTYGGAKAEQLSEAEYDAIQPKSKKLAALGEGAVLQV